MLASIKEYLDLALSINNNKKLESITGIRVVNPITFDDKLHLDLCIDCSLATAISKLIVFFNFRQVRSNIKLDSVVKTFPSNDDEGVTHVFICEDTKLIYIINFFRYEYLESYYNTYISTDVALLANLLSKYYNDKNFILSKLYEKITV